MAETLTDGSLHENPTASRIFVSSYCLDLGCYCPDCGHELDTWYYRERLHTVGLPLFALDVTDIVREQPAHFTCPNGKTFFSNSITWGRFLLVYL